MAVPTPNWPNARASSSARCEAAAELAIDRDHRGPQVGEGRDQLRDLDVRVADALEVGGRDLGEVAIHLLVEHQLFAALGPDAPRVVVDDVRDHERAAFRWLGEASELDLEVDEQGVAAAPGMGEDFVGDPRESRS